MQQLEIIRDEIKDLNANLDPDNLNRIMISYRKGGYSSRSMGNGTRGSGDRPLPLRDALDRKIAEDSTAFTKALQQARDALREAARIQRFWSTPAPEPEPLTCGNDNCNAQFHGRLRNGLCPRCYMHWYRHGVHFPFKQEEPEAA